MTSTKHSLYAADLYVVRNGPKQDSDDFLGCEHFKGQPAAAGNENQFYTKTMQHFCTISYFYVKSSATDRVHAMKAFNT